MQPLNIPSLMTSLITTFFTQTPISPFDLVSQHFNMGPDESQIFSYTYEENEHYTNKGTDGIACDKINDFCNLFPHIFLIPFNDLLIANRYEMLTPSFNTGLIHLFTNTHNDSLLIQFSDHRIYITFTLSGQY